MAKIFWLFVLYSFLGFLLEVAFARITHAGKQDRKCLYIFPLCPVYGFGALAILALVPLARGSWPVIFLLGAAAATGVEYLYDLLCDKFLHVRFWDYSHLPANVGGRVCLLFTSFWGLLALVVVQLIQPGIELLVNLIPGWIFFPAALLLSADILFTVLLLSRTRHTDSLCWYRQIQDRLQRHS